MTYEEKAEQDRRLWHHALDRCTNERWQELLQTQDQTVPQYILTALEYALDYDRLDHKLAREVLRRLGHEEPAGKSQSLLESPVLRVANMQQGPFPAFTAQRGELAKIWAIIHGLETGWFCYRGGFLRYTKSALARKQAAARQADAKSKATEQAPAAPSCEPTRAGLQFVLPGCERKEAPATAQLSLF